MPLTCRSNPGRYKYLNKSIMNNKVESAIKILQTQTSPGVGGFIAEFQQTFKEELKLMFLRLFHKIEEERLLPNSFHEASITLTPKTSTVDKHAQKKAAG